jgi:predicted deacylase
LKARHWQLGLLAFALTLGIPSLGGVALGQAGSPTDCKSGPVTLDGDFEGSGFAQCRRLGPSFFSLTIAPEDGPPINCSPWYAFRIRQPRASPTPVRVQLLYAACGHRYAPKISVDTIRWSKLPPSSVTITQADRRTAEIVFTSDQPETYVAAQELIVGGHYKDQFDSYASRPGVKQKILGQSYDGRPIVGLFIHTGKAPASERVLLIGRQHPAEVTGALAMDAFLAALLSNNPIAVAYRARFETIAVPLLNPDGVARGYWRHNRGHKDLNRDWRVFSEPETAAVDRILRTIESNPKGRLRMVIDFHSTRTDMIYSIPDALATDPPMVSSDWIARLRARLPGYHVNRIQEHQPGLPTAKTGLFERYGIPTATLEIGDETDRAWISWMGRQAALAMMETMLATEAPSKTSPDIQPE